MGAVQSDSEDSDLYAHGGYTSARTVSDRAKLEEFRLDVLSAIRLSSDIKALKTHVDELFPSVDSVPLRMLRKVSQSLIDRLLVQDMNALNRIEDLFGRISRGGKTHVGKPTVEWYLTCVLIVILPIATQEANRLHVLDRPRKPVPHPQQNRFHRVTPRAIRHNRNPLPEHAPHHHSMRRCSSAVSCPRSPPTLLSPQVHRAVATCQLPIASVKLYRDRKQKQEPLRQCYKNSIEDLQSKNSAEDLTQTSSQPNLSSRANSKCIVSNDGSPLSHVGSKNSSSSSNDVPLTKSPLACWATHDFLLLPPTQACCDLQPTWSPKQHGACGSHRHPLHDACIEPRQGDAARRYKKMQEALARAMRLPHWDCDSRNKITDLKKDDEESTEPSSTENVKRPRQQWHLSDLDALTTTRRALENEGQEAFLLMGDGVWHRKRVTSDEISISVRNEVTSPLFSNYCGDLEEYRFYFSSMHQAIMKCEDVVEIEMNNDQFLLLKFACHTARDRFCDWLLLRIAVVQE
eukprot:GEMP01020652.1.p1 GENE.GEMP01020652.1~~GEMP01020652.1.p1  ORF type:complete len:517 (+),score=95.75 GEMP01020652.1:133-1683(+)